MQNQEMNHSANKTRPQKGVIITVYVETPIKQTNNSHQNPNLLKNTNLKALPKTPRPIGYDRRAQLLAYSRELRNGDSSTTQFPKAKSKKWKWKVKPETAAVRRWRYERVGKRREERTEVVDHQRCRPNCFNGGNNNNNNSTAQLMSSSIFRKLKSLLGELSKGCKRGGHHH